MFSKFSLNHLTDRLSPVQLILIFYFLAVIVSTVVLALPVAHLDGIQPPFLDILFTAVSALSVTGLSTVTIADTFSTSGIILLCLILQLGGVGVMATGTFIWLMFGKRISLKERRLIMTDQNQTTFEGMVRLIKQILLLILSIELIGFIVLGTYFLQYYPTAGESYLNGFFAAISATTNGGFDITGNSLIPFKNDYFVQFITIALIIFGAIGYPVLVETKNYLFSKSQKNTCPFRFSLFTKVTTITFFSLVVIGTIVIFLLDGAHYFSDKSWHETLFYAIFQSVTTRSAGLQTLDVSQLTGQTHLFLSFLMFIGASPSSAGGGIRTTTFALVIIFLITFARGGNSIRLFRREIHEEDLLKAVAVMLVGIILIFASVLLLTVLEPFSLSELLFEVTSAFGTVGLSLGITAKLTATSKIILMLLMFIGRVGIITFLLTFKKNKHTGKYHYPKERMIIG